MPWTEMSAVGGGTCESGSSHPTSGARLRVPHDVSLIAIPESFFRERSRLPQISAGQERVFVVPQEEALALARHYAYQQRDFGKPLPIVVKTLVEAYELLAMDKPSFVAVP
jgi:hypothetical protein